MKVTTDLRPGVEVDLELVRDVSLAWVRLPDLAAQDEGELRRAHAHALGEAFVAEGPSRTDIYRRIAKPIEAEMRHRALEADYWSADHRRRSDEAFRLELN